MRGRGDRVILEDLVGKKMYSGVCGTLGVTGRHWVVREVGSGLGIWYTGDAISASRATRYFPETWLYGELWISLPSSRLAIFWNAISVRRHCAPETR